MTCVMSPPVCRDSPGLRGVPVVSVGLVQREVRRLGHQAPHTLRADAVGQPRRGLPSAGGGEEVHPGELLMTRPGTEGGKGEEGEDEQGEGEKKEEGQEGKGETEKQLEALCTYFT